MCCGPGLLLCCHSGQLQLIWFCPGHLSRTSLSGRLPLFCSLTKTCEWLGGYPWALHSLQGHRGLFMCDKYTYFSLNRLCDRSLALAFHHPWGSLQETEGLLPGCGFKMSALGTVVPQPHRAAHTCCSWCLWGSQTSEAGALWWDATRERKTWDFWACGLCCWAHSDLCSSRLSSFGWLRWHPGDIFSWGWAPYVPVPLLSWAPCPRADSFQCSRFCLPFLPSEHT